MADQKKIFTDSEGDSWYQRNTVDAEKFEAKKLSDALLPELKKLSAPKSVLEVGASNGWRLAAMKEMWPDARLCGVDHSAEAVATAYDGAEMLQATADNLPYEDGSFDLVVFGFCLYLCDREDLFKIAAEADRVLAEGGKIVIYDFYTEQPYKNPYAHQDGVYSYKFDYSKLFDWNPSYKVSEKITRPHVGYEYDDSPDNQVGIIILTKDTKAAWPDNPYK